MDTLTSRNFGWLPQETRIAVSHIASVIRDDEGVNPRYELDGRGHGIPYRIVLLGIDARVPWYLRIPPQYRIDVTNATDDQVVYAVAKLMHAYIDSLRFGTKKTFRDSTSPYDLFLEKNHLPTEPKELESSSMYITRLLRLIRRRKHLRWVTPKDDRFSLHDQPYQFGPSELYGFTVFCSRQGRSRHHNGNCVSCHQAPQFTDHRFHNNGVSQIEYDALFGPGAFADLAIPSLATRNMDFDQYLPPTSQHPNATGRLRSAPKEGQPGHTDLGMWNVLGNPDIPKPQASLITILCAHQTLPSDECTPDKLLPSTIAFFKTPSVRDLGQSNPYFHSGSVDTIEDVIRFYIRTSTLARARKLRNASRELTGVRIDYSDVAPLAAFLRSLNEDYH